jgi:DNA-binding NarL/FixJ family response regulator
LNDELRENLNLIRDFAHVLLDRSVLEPEEITDIAASIEEQSERALQVLDEATAADTTSETPEQQTYGLSARELEVLRHVANGLADKQIAKALGLSTNTVSKHVGAILSKMSASSRTEAGVRALRENLI